MTAKKVLIVDDEADICELIEITLMRMDIASQSALNLSDARLLLDTEHFDLCLTDMRLPDGNGIELVEHVQQKFYRFAHRCNYCTWQHGVRSQCIKSWRF